MTERPGWAVIVPYRLMDFRCSSAVHPETHTHSPWHSLLQIDSGIKPGGLALTRDKHINLPLAWSGAPNSAGPDSRSSPTYFHWWKEEAIDNSVTGTLPGDRGLGERVSRSLQLLHKPFNWLQSQSRCVSGKHIKIIISDIWEFW